MMALELGIPQFTASSGWIDRFKNRHGLGNKDVFRKSGNSFSCIGCIPRDENRRKAWLSAMKRENFKVTASSRICSKHFSEENFDREKFGGTWLKRDAVPSIFPPIVKKGENKQKCPKKISNSPSRFADTEVAECKNRWRVVRDSFPDYIPETKRNKMTVDFAESIYDIPGNNKSNDKSISESVPLQNPNWLPGSANSRLDDAKPSTSNGVANTKSPVINTISPVIKLEMDIEEESKTDPLYTTDENNSDYGYIIPSTVCEVVTEPHIQSSHSVTQQPHIQRTPEFDCGTSNERREIGTELESSDSNIEHPIEMFFKSMAATVKTFPPHLMAIAKLKVCKIITDLELQALTETGLSSAGFCGKNGSGASKCSTTESNKCS
ncbi:major centromere autoantigen B [Caerostris extrusa]|uniref:Major centromere autoantigen B n=1 Tax=Caerostris extrusa TaxID=172846 RepID=A0AAV4UUD2_CAEEX|nr:major centromere autoantigen B [Caerostris extrusa]